MKAVIIGGVAAGASAAARLRRLDESAQIILLERGGFISYANCGLPYHIGGVIPDRDDLLVMTPKKFAAWYNVDVRINSSVEKIIPNSKTVLVKSGGKIYEESYDKLLIATGARPSKQKTEGDDSQKIANLWTMSDMDNILSKLSKNVGKVAVVGAGFVGLETAENLRERGLGVVVIQRSPHVMPTLDFEMAYPLAKEISSLGIDLKLARTISKYEDTGNSLKIHLDNSEIVEADFAIVGTGVTPNSELAKNAGIKCGERGHIRVDKSMRTSEDDIYAAGDAVEIYDPVLNTSVAIPLAGPANKQGRIAANNMASVASEYGGTIGASVVKIGKLTAASVGYTEKRLTAEGKTFKKIYLHPSSNASYYPNASRMHIKLLFGGDGSIFGAQIVGEKGVDKRIDTIAQAMKNGLKAPRLGELELSYAPSYNSAKDPVNYAGFIAENVLLKISDVVYPDTIPANAQIIDVREPSENAAGAIDASINIRLGELRSRLAEIDKNRPVVTVCQVGLRGYVAERILKQNGYQAANLSGGYATWKMWRDALKLGK